MPENKLALRVSRELDNASRVAEILSEINDIREVNVLRARAQEIREYFDGIKGKEVEATRAHTIELQAQRRGGEILIEMKERGQLKQGRPRKSSNDLSFFTLESLELTFNDSSYWRRLARIPESDWEELLGRIEEIRRVGNALVAKETRKHLQKAKLAERGRLARLPPSLRVIPGDFTKLLSNGKLVSDNSVDMVFTDPLYDEKSLPLYTSVAEMASKKLREGGSLFVMSGQMYHNKIVRRLDDACSNGLQFNWIVGYILGLNYSNSIFPKEIMTAWKPILWYSKGGVLGGWHHDTIGPTPPDKTLDKLQQDVEGAEQLIERYTVESEMVLDPMCGTGTFGVACARLKRSFLGIDLDPANVLIAKGRIDEELAKR